MAAVLPVGLSKKLYSFAWSLRYLISFRFCLQLSGLPNRLMRLSFSLLLSSQIPPGEPPFRVFRTSFRSFNWRLKLIRIYELIIRFSTIMVQQDLLGVLRNIVLFHHSPRPFLNQQPFVVYPIELTIKILMICVQSFFKSLSRRK